MSALLPVTCRTRNIQYVMGLSDFVGFAVKRKTWNVKFPRSRFTFHVSLVVNP